MAISLLAFVGSCFLVFLIGYQLGYASGHSRGRLDVLEEEHLEVADGE